MANDVNLKERLAFAVFWAMWRRDMSPPQLAAAIGRDANTVRRWRDGETAPSVLDVGALARALGVRVDFFTDPPEVPDYPFAEYTVEPDLEGAVVSGVQEGIRRANTHADAARARRPRSLVRPVPGDEAER